MLLQACRSNLAYLCASVCESVWVLLVKNHKRNGEQESYVYSCIADSAVLVKVTAHLLADIQPVCSYTLPWQQQRLVGSVVRPAAARWLVIGCHSTVWNEVDFVTAVD